MNLREAVRELDGKSFCTKNSAMLEAEAICEVLAAAKKQLAAEEATPPMTLAALAEALPSMSGVDCTCGREHFTSCPTRALQLSRASKILKHLHGYRESGGDYEPRFGCEIDRILRGERD